MDDLSSGGDSKVEEDSEKRLAKEKEGKDRDHEREQGTGSSASSVNVVFDSFCESFA